MVWHTTWCLFTVHHFALEIHYRISSVWGQKNYQLSFYPFLVLFLVFFLIYFWNISNLDIIAGHYYYVKGVLRFWCSLKTTEDLSISFLIQDVTWHLQRVKETGSSTGSCFAFTLRTQEVKPWIRMKKPTQHLTQKVCFYYLFSYVCNWCCLHKSIYNCISFLKYWNALYSVTGSDNQEEWKSQGEKTVFVWSQLLFCVQFFTTFDLLPK